MFVDIGICIVLKILEQKKKKKKEDHQSYVSSYHYASIKMEINGMETVGQQPLCLMKTINIYLMAL